MAWYGRPKVLSKEKPMDSSIDDVSKNDIIQDDWNDPYSWRRATYVVFEM